MRRITRVFHKISFGNKIFIFNALIFIVALFVLSFAASKVSTRAIMDKAQSSAVRELQLIDKNLETMVKSIEDYLRMISSEYRLQQTLLTIDKNKKNGIDKLPLETIRISSLMSSIVSNIVAPSTQLVGSSILIENEVVYSGYTLGRFDPVQVLGNDYFESISSLGRPVWSGLFTLPYDSGTTKNTFAVGKAIIDKDTGIETGTVVVFVDETNISKIYLENKTNEADRFFIVNSEGVIVSANVKSDLYKPAEEILGITNDEYVQLINDGSRIITSNGTQYLYSAHHYKEFDWDVVSIISLDEIMEENKNITKALLIVTSLCLLMAFVLSYFISNRLVNPIIRLTHTTKDIIKGDISIRARTDVGGEVGILTEGFNNLMDRIESLIDEVNQENKKQREMEFRLLQSQISPHFLYNALETINSFITLGMLDKANETVNNLSQFYRICLSKGDDVISIKNELKITCSYLNIQKFRYMEFMDFEMDIDENINNYSIPKLTLQPIVENAIYHGLKNKSKKGLLSIKGYFLNEEIIIEIADDGVGISSDKISQIMSSGETDGPSYGLSNIQNRLRLKYGNKGRIEIESEVGVMTKVLVHILPVKL